MSTQNVTDFQPVLKQLYPENVMKELFYKDRPFFGMVRKNTGFGGDVMKVPLVYGNPQGRSAAFSTAQSNKTTSKEKAFLVQRVKDYAVASLTNEVIKASQKDEYAFAKALQLEMDGAINSICQSLAIAMWRSGSGSIGRLSSTQSAGASTATLANESDITNFEVGQKIVFSSANGGGSVKSGSGWVVAVDRDAGTFQLSATEGGSAAALSSLVATIAASDYVFVEGDYDAKMSGVQAWIPETVSGSDSFFGVNRSADRTRLAGIYMDQTGVPMEEALINLVTRIAREGGNPRHVFMCYEDYANLEKSLGTRVQYVDVKPGSDVAFGYRGIAMNSPKGVLQVIPDQTAPAGYANALTLESWELASLGQAPTVFDTDGIRMLRESNADSLEFRIYSYHNLVCNAPGWNGIAKLR